MGALKGHPPTTEATDPQSYSMEISASMLLHTQTSKVLNDFGCREEDGEDQGRGTHRGHHRGRRHKETRLFRGGDNPLNISNRSQPDPL